MAIKSRKRIISLGAIGAAAQSAQIGVGGSYDGCIIYSTAASTLKLQGTPDGGTTWYDVATSGAGVTSFRVAAPIPSDCRVETSAASLLNIEFTRSVGGQ